MTRRARTAFLTALMRAGEHGLPLQRYDVPGLMEAFDAVRSERDRGALEARMSRIFLQFATDLHSGVLDPIRVDPDIVRVLPRPDAAQLMADFAKAPAAGFIRNLAPAAPGICPAVPRQAQAGNGNRPRWLGSCRAAGSVLRPAVRGQPSLPCATGL